MRFTGVLEALLSLVTLPGIANLTIKYRRYRRQIGEPFRALLPRSFRDKVPEVLHDMRFRSVDGEW